MPTYCDLVEAAALGAAAADTFTAVGTVTMRPGPGVILGFITNGTANANTAAEAYVTQFRFDLGEVGLKELTVTGMPGVGEHVATQSSGDGLPAQFHPANIPFKGNENIDITAGHHLPAPTAGLNAQAAVFYSQPPHPPKEWFDAFPGIMGGSGGDSEANGAVTADRTAITDLQIPALARHVCGFASTSGQDAAGRTAEDLVYGLDFTSTFPDFTPQQYPMMSKYPNLAGTLVGTGITMPRVVWPAWIPTNGVSGQITPTCELVTAVTDREETRRKSDGIHSSLGNT
jgi:hypothetical protein